jgi:arylsulfatase A-like enzyme
VGTLVVLTACTQRPQDKVAIRGVVLVSLDTLRRDHVSLYGYGRSTTPRLDALGREGIVFDDAVSVSSWTLPAHLSMLTAVEPAAHGGIDGHHGFNQAVPTIAQTLLREGFVTHAITSHIYVSSEYGLQAGFDRFDYREGRLATEVADRALEALDGIGTRPFFLFLHFYDPHWPYAPPPPFAGSFGPGQSPGEATLARPPAEAPPRDPRSIINDYDAEIRYADTELGRVLDHLRRTGLDRNLLVIVTSDHGEEFADHGGYEHRRTLYEEIIRVPLVVQGRGISPRREAASVTLLDIAPTILEAVGLAPQATHQGRSLLGSVSARDAYGETELGARHTGARTRKLFLRAGAKGAKLILSMDRRSGRTLLEEWYDLEKDPGERQGIAPRDNVRADLRDRLVRRWRQAQARAVAAPGVELTAQQAERLQALGYTE